MQNKILRIEKNQQVNWLYKRGMGFDSAPQQAIRWTFAKKILDVWLRFLWLNLPLVIVVVLFIQPSHAVSSHTIVKPGGSVIIRVGEVKTASWLSRPLWRSETVRIVPDPQVDSNGEHVVWTAANVKTNESSINLNKARWTGRTDNKNGKPIIRSRKVLVEFELNNDERLIGATLSAHVLVKIRYSTGGIILTRTIDKDVTFKVGTADEIQKSSIARIKFMILLAGGVILLFSVTALLMRISSKPAPGLMKSLNDWRTSQLSRFELKPVHCPYCQAISITEKICSNCGKTLLKGRLVSRFILIIVPAFAIMMAGVMLSNASFIYYAMKDILTWGTGGIIVIVIIYMALRSALSEMLQGFSAFMSALFLPASLREKHARLANKIITSDKIADPESKAIALGLALCQPFSSLTGFHIADPTCGLSFWNEMNETGKIKSITSTTRDVLTDLIFIENLQLCIDEKAYRAEGDARIEMMIASANDSKYLLDAAKIVRTKAEGSDWLKNLIEKVASKIRDKAPMLADVLSKEMYVSKTA